MRKLSYFVGSSIDGFIASPDGQHDFLAFEGDFAAAVMADYPETLPAPARESLGLTGVANKRFDTIVMGRGTYDPGLAVGLTSPYPHLEQYVFSRTLTQVDPEVEIVTGDPAGFVRGLKRQEGGMEIWLSGGAGLAGELLEEIDELIVKVYPVVVGTGIPLFRSPFAPHGFAVTDVHTFATGALITTYTRTV
ncbi:dihydrofolate reductase family protein [Streptomyces sp. NPDC013953]|uniref:dihydrofolate reductase family protein n=1 Tax=Streptomyces sp. NPDC013953 TaxID=3364868 RepID=UPI0036FA119F